MEAIKKIHHISAIVGNVHENLKFYRDILGLSLIKQTVNFDDPSVYHLYFSDEKMKAIITFFPWENASKGIKGTGQVGCIAFRIPKGSINFWYDKLVNHQIQVSRQPLFGLSALLFEDFHGLELALIETDEVRDSKGIYQFHGVVLNSANPQLTKHYLENTLGLTTITTNHFVTNGTEKHHILVNESVMPKGRWGVGTVHHIAWSLPDEASQLEWQDYFLNQPQSVTEVKDRQYFKAIYTKEPGNIIFEFATEGPGFTVDEPLENLGKSLKLPAHYEAMRADIEMHLAPLGERHD